jgi:hypothetical protein
MNDKKVKTVRADVGQQLERIKRSFAAVASGYPSDAALQTSITHVGENVDKYKKETDAAIDLSAADPNTGVAAMQSADVTFSELEAWLRSISGLSFQPCPAFVAVRGTYPQHASAGPGAFGVRRRPHTKQASDVQAAVARVMACRRQSAPSTGTSTVGRRSTLAAVTHSIETVIQANRGCDLGCLTAASGGIVDRESY